MRSLQNRRSFLSCITGLAAGGGAALAAGTGEAGVSQAGSTVMQTAPAAAQPAWDTTWLDSFTGRHKQLFDLLWHELRPNTLSPPLNYFEAHKELSRLEFPDVNVVIGIDSTSFPINASDALWAKYKLGERYKVTDPGTGQAATRNIYLGPPTDAPGATVRGLQARGALFLMCNNSLRRLSNEWSRETGRPAPELHAELVAGLNPGVKVVPALTWAVGMLQERSFTLQKL